MLNDECPMTKEIRKTNDPVRQSRNQTECARPRAQKRRTATGVELIPNLKPRRSCCGRGRPHSEDSSQLANNFEDCSARARYGVAPPSSFRFRHALGFGHSSFVIYEGHLSFSQLDETAAPGS